MASQHRISQAKSSKLPLLIGVIVLIVGGLVGLVLIRDDNSADNSANNSEAVSSVTQGRITPQEYNDIFVANNTTHQLIDVRTSEEFASGYIEGAINIPVDDLASRLDEIETDMPIVVYCRSGNRSARAATILRDAGFENVYDLGGVLDWTDAGFSLQR